MNTKTKQNEATMKLGGVNSGICGQSEHKALVTGGAGFIGAHISKALIEREFKVTVYDNLSTGKIENIPSECDFILGDVRNFNSIESAVKGKSIIFHNAAFVSIRKSFSLSRENILSNEIGIINLLEAAVANNVKAVIFASSMAVYGKHLKYKINERDTLSPNSPYGLSKMMGELLCEYYSKKHQIACASLRYFNAYGEGQVASDYVGVLSTFIHNALHGKPMCIFGDGEQTRDFIWAQDIACANILSLNSLERGKNKIYNIGSGKATSIIQIAQRIKDSIPEAKTRFAPAPWGEIRHILSDNQKAYREINFSPKGDLLSMIPDLIKKARSKIGE